MIEFNEIEQNIERFFEGLVSDKGISKDYLKQKLENFCAALQVELEYSVSIELEKRNLDIKEIDSYLMDIKEKIQSEKIYYIKNLESEDSDIEEKLRYCKLVENKIDKFISGININNSNKKMKREGFWRSIINFFRGRNTERKYQDGGYENVIQVIANIELDANIKERINNCIIGNDIKVIRNNLDKEFEQIRVELESRLKNLSDINKEYKAYIDYMVLTYKSSF